MEKKMVEMIEERMSEMMDQFAVKQGEKVEAMIQASVEKMTQAITAISLQNHHNALKSEKGEGSSNGATVIHGNPVNSSEEQDEWDRSTRYEFPKFDGVGFEGWVMRAEYFFEVARVPERKRVKVAAIHLEGKAMQWHKGFAGLHGDVANVDWGYYISALSARFGEHAFEDPLADLRNLKQVGTLQQYMDEFDELYPRAEIKEGQALSFFLSGLVDELQMPVRMFKPKNLADAYSLAKLQELTVKALGGKARGTQSGGSSSGSHYSNTKPLAVTATSSKQQGAMGSWSNGGNREGNRMGVRASTNLSPKEIEEKKARKECFWCTEKFTPNHHCAKRKSFVIQMLEQIMQEEEEREQPDEKGEEEENGIDLQLSLHAVC